MIEQHKTKMPNNNNPIQSNSRLTVTAKNAIQQNNRKIQFS